MRRILLEQVSLCSAEVSARHETGLPKGRGKTDFDPVNDFDTAALINFGNITGVNPTFLINGLSSVVFIYKFKTSQKVYLRVVSSTHLCSMLKNSLHHEHKALRVD